MLNCTLKRTTPRGEKENACEFNILAKRNGGGTVCHT